MRERKQSFQEKNFMKLYRYSAVFYDYPTGTTSRCRLFRKWFKDDVSA